MITDTELRDQFAGQTMTAIVTTTDLSEILTVDKALNFLESTAKLSYALADAMMKVRSA